MADKIICEVCGKEFLDSRGIRMHMAMHERQTEQTEQKVEEKEVIMTGEKVKEVEIKPEKDVIEKKEVKEVDFNSCGECGQTFKGFPNYCPKCGAQFE